MRICSIFVLAMASLLGSSIHTAVATVNSDQAKASPNVEPISRRTLFTHDRDTPQRSLRVHDREDGDELGEEERVGGTDIVKWAHPTLSHADAKMVRQIAKGNSAKHILDKLDVPYNVINGERVYSRLDPDYVRYVKWLKKYRDDPLTFPN